MQFFCRARRIFFFCPVASTLQGAQNLFLFDRSLPLCRARRFFLGCPLAAAQQRQARSDLSGRCLVSFDSSRNNFFLTGRLCPTLSARTARDSFFLSGHSRASVSGRHAEIFFCHNHAQVQGAQKFSFAQLFRSLRSKLSFAVLSHRRYAANLFCGCPIASEQQSARAEIFSFHAEVSGGQGAQKFVFFWPVRSPPRSSLLAQNYFYWGRAVFFSFAVRSHLRRTF
jgi:hypothetical protein